MLLVLSVTLGTLPHDSFHEKSAFTKMAVPRMDSWERTPVTEVAACESFVLPVIPGGPRGFLCYTGRVGGCLGSLTERGGWKSLQQPST